MEITKRPVPNSTSWEVDFGKDATGTRRRPRFKSEELAEAAIVEFKAKAKKLDDYLARMPQIRRNAIAQTLQEMDVAQVELSMVWTEWKNRKKEVSSQSTTTPKAYADVVAEFNRRKLAAGKTTRYTDNTTKFFARFGAGRERQNIHEITTEDLEKWLDQQVIELKWSMSTNHSPLLGQRRQRNFVAKHMRRANRGVVCRALCRDLLAERWRANEEIKKSQVQLRFINNK